MRLKKQNKGDTIVEVLICLAILGFIMTLAYSVSTRSLQNIRRAQERIEALKIAEGQLELLKTIQKNSSGNFTGIAAYVADTPFCITTTGSNPSPVTFNAPIDAWDPEISNVTEFKYPAGCKDLGPGGLYNVAIVSPNNSDGGTFTVYVRWFKLGGGTAEQLTLEYVLYADSY